jgi:Outer membrane cobalamin receptor protein
MRAVIGTGYRAPSLYQRFDPTFGNPDLGPETSRSAEIGVEKRYGGGSFAKATLFRTDVDDLIDYNDPDGYLGPIPGSYSQVEGTTTITGLELSGQHVFSERLSAFGSYTYTEAKTGEERLLLAPRHDLSVGVAAGLTGRLDARIALHHTGDRVDFGPIALEDFTVLNAGLRYDLGNGATAYLRVENLLDEDYEVVNGYNSAGRTVHLGLRAAF